MLDSILIPLILAASTMDMANERLLASGAELEQHWQVDCRAVVLRSMQLVESPRSSMETTELQILIADAKKCAVIYNTANTGRTMECPDYRQIGVYLGQLAEGTPVAHRPEILDCDSPAP